MVVQSDGDALTFKDEIRLYGSMIPNQLGFLILFDGSSVRVPVKLYRVLFEKARLPTPHDVSQLVTIAIDLMAKRGISLKLFDIQMDPLTARYYTEAGYPTTAILCQCDESFPIHELQLALEDALTASKKSGPPAS